MICKDRLISFALLMSTLLLNGCGVFNIGGKDQSREVAKTPAEQKKAKLLKKIDRKFENPQAHFELGQLYQAEGRWSQAENEYHLAVIFDPVHWRAQAARVKALIELDDKTKSELLADDYISQASHRAQASLRLAMAFQEQQLDEYAFTCYQQALRLAPTSAKINRQIGYYYLSKNDKARARDYLMRSFDLNPMQPEVAGELGRLGVLVDIPRKTSKHTRKLDKIVEQSDKKTNP